MADKKTSQETSGAPIQGGDLWRIARTGSNYKLTSVELFSEKISVATFLTKITNSELIAGRWYAVTDPFYIGTAYVMADSANTYEKTGYFDWGVSKGICCFGGGIDQQPTFYIDEFGNRLSFACLSGGLPPVNNQNYFANEYNTASVLPSASINTTIINSTTIAHPRANISASNLNSANIQDASGVASGDLYVIGCVLDGYSANFGYTTISDMDGNGGFLQNCNFYNCTVKLLNSPTIYNLTIYGNGGEVVIDGKVNGIRNNWQGVVHVDPVFGSSTVEADFTWSNIVDQNTINADNENIYITDQSIVGIYHIPNYPGTLSNPVGSSFDLRYIIGNSKVPFKLIVDQMTGGSQPSLKLNSSQNGLSGNEIVGYHGITSKVHQLYHKNNWVELYDGLSDDGTGNKFLKYGCHYDL